MGFTKGFYAFKKVLKNQFNPPLLALNHHFKTNMNYFIE